LFSVKRFAVGVPRYFGSAVAAIAASNIAATIAAPKRAGSSVELQTSVTERLERGGLIRETAKENIGNGCGPHFPLWIKVPPKHLSQ
jgi:hypothetical protein